MKLRKIRHQARRQREIQAWVANTCLLDLSFLVGGGRHYVKFRIAPWGNLILRNSRARPLKGKTKAVFLRGLMQIFEAWETQLEALGQPYYLKIWLYLPHLHESQVVVAVGRDRGFYENTFDLIEKEMRFPMEQLGHVGRGLANLNWQATWDEYPLGELSNAPKEQLSTNIRIVTWRDKQDREHTQAFRVKGKIWLGGR